MHFFVHHESSEVYVWLFYSKDIQKRYRYMLGKKTGTIMGHESYGYFSYKKCSGKSLKSTCLIYSCHIWRINPGNYCRSFQDWLTWRISWLLWLQVAHFHLCLPIWIYPIATRCDAGQRSYQKPFLEFDQDLRPTLVLLSSVLQSSEGELKI